MQELYYKWNGYILKCLIDSSLKAKEQIEIMGKGFAQLVDYSHIDNNDKISKFTLAVHESAVMKGIKEDNNYYHLFLNNDDYNESEMLPCVLLHLYLREMVKNNILPFHAAAVSYNGNGILMLSETGGGKTAIMYELCREHGASIISNDFFAGEINSGVIRKVVSDNTSLISFRKGLYEEREATKTVLFKGNEDRKYFSTHELGLDCFPERNNITIDFMCWVELTSCRNNQIYRMSEIEKYYRYHYNIVNYLSGVTLMLFDANGRWVQNMPTFLNGCVLNNLHQLIKEMCEYYRPVEYIGGKDFIVGEILNGMK